MTFNYIIIKNYQLYFLKKPQTVISYTIFYFFLASTATVFLKIVFKSKIK